MVKAKRVPQKSLSNVSRRDFLRVGGLSVVSLTVAEQAARARTQAGADEKSCIFILMTGGPSQLETFDPKPDASLDIRGPMKAISTSVPDMFLSESLPRLAQRADRFTLLRTLHHDAAPIHETGHQLLQTGRLAHRGAQYPSFGSVVARTLGPRGNVAPFVVLPRTLGDTGVNAYRGQHAGFLGDSFGPLTSDSVLDSEMGNSATIGELLSKSAAFEESSAVRRAYGDHRFGRLCLEARQLVECGVRCVTVNLFDSLPEQVTFDCHARPGWAPGNLFDYRDSLCPRFDQSLSALIDDLSQRGLLDNTLVVAVGEMGRTPYINEFGGRDHWPAACSALVAGGCTTSGRCIGATDREGAQPIARPIAFPELTASIYQFLGLDVAMPLSLDSGDQVPLVDHPAIGELFA